jgi:hypothetical protein
MKLSVERCAKAGLWVACLVGLGCQSDGYPFDATDPGRGPADLIGAREPLNASFEGGLSADPEAAGVTPPTDAALPGCDEDCRSYCEDLGLDNPLDRGACRGLWGVGLDTQPIDEAQACRRLFADLLGRLPSQDEAEERCGDGDWSQVASEMVNDERFVFVNRRLWADALRYNNEAISFERIYDADEAVKKLYEGRIAYDEFAALVSAHPVLTRRYDNAGDRAAALFAMFLGRPPYDNERSDMARLYVLWENGYFDHPALGLRLPDAVLGFRCLNEAGTRPDPASAGECTSVLWGYNELIFTPDYRAVDGQLWSGFLTADEWHALQEPGRIIAKQLGFWEHVVDEVMGRYLGYDLTTRIPEVRQELVAYLLQHQGDIRALHYAVVTSQLYLQRTTSAAPTAHRHTYGPLKQIEVEPWIDTVKATTGYALSRCDHRLPDPEEILDTDSIAAQQLIEDSDWDLDDDGVVSNYRDLARTLGGCPDNGVSGRFKTISILTTAVQEGFVARVCNPGLNPGEGAEIARLLPDGVGADKALSGALAESIVDHQVRTFFGRKANEEELAEARSNADSCAPKPCRAESFARPVCYALLSSSEMLFY